MNRLFIALTCFAIAFGWGTIASAKPKVVVPTISNLVPEVQTSVIDTTKLDGLYQPKLMMFYTGGVITVSCLNADAAKVIFRVKSDANAIVYSERSKEMVYHNRLSTKNLKEGAYKAEIIKGKQIYELSFNVL